MPKLRKMLGSADHPTVQKLMRLIETQNKQTLAAWAVDYVAAHDLPILTAHGGDIRWLWRFPDPSESRGRNTPPMPQPQ